MNHLFLIIRREYLERVRRKSFIISTLLTPLFMLALMCAPAAIMYFSGPESKNIAVIDNSGAVGQYLKSDGELNFVLVTENVDSVKQNEDYDAVLILDADVVKDPSHIAFFTHGSPSMQTEQVITSYISSIISQTRLQSYNIDNLDRILQDVNVHASMRTYRLDTETVEETSSTTSYLIGMIMMMMLYMFILLYGNMVLTSIIEEKTNRVLEVVVSSTSPTRLLIGKIAGIGMVAITQIVIWAAIIIAFSAWGLPIMLNQMSAVTPEDVSMIEMLKSVFSSAAMFKLFTFMILFLAGGFMFYSSIYAAIGASVDNMQDATQLQSIAMVPIILGLIVAMSVAADPTSTVSVWGSMIPFTSPMVMMARLPFGVEGWQIALSLAILYVTTIGMVWLSAKIYRVGIFMYGKKPTVRDLIRWARYK